MWAGVRCRLRTLVKDVFDLLGLLDTVRKIRAVIATEAGKRRLKAAAVLTPLRIVVGSGGTVQPGWTDTEKTYLDLLDPKGWEKYFKPGCIDAILAEHVWEHLTLEQGFIAATTCRRFLKKGGYLRVAVPDGRHPDRGYIDRVKPGGTGPGADDHKVLYDCVTLSEIISRAGLEVRPLEYFDKNGEFVFNDWSVADGMIHRSCRYDERNRDGKLNFTSVIIDAYNS